jgi:hypothetical protein
MIVLLFELVSSTFKLFSNIFMYEFETPRFVLFTMWLLDDEAMIAAVLFVITQDEEFARTETIFPTMTEFEQLAMVVTPELNSMSLLDELAIVVLLLLSTVENDEFATVTPLLLKMRAFVVLETVVSVLLYIVLLLESGNCVAHSRTQVASKNHSSSLIYLYY